MDIIADLLLQWCRKVCSFHELKVDNFSGSFTDGRVLSRLIAHYQPSIVRRDDVCDVTTTNYDASQDTHSYEQLVQNEKSNFSLVKQACYQLGGIPGILRIDDMCGTIPDAKVVKLIVAYLFTRLSDTKSEDR
uniref:abnormal spindle-like microcephaly-associated protein homolog n=1 Tax=Ciona intestinalis TaxID=7719 RepID=UPI000EF55563|nr:abnormal spindle-like microcephaly-associated protein homolog [Ciona intestinalis]|eukprot:XP_026695551.1 abnormal spindle-like microcephaly-associated protein homolog [Ciona intestinalis]